MEDSPEPTRITAERGWVPPSVERLQEVLPAYEILELLGAGGMGAVYQARQKSLKRLVAIKILPLGLGGDEFQFVERFRNEAQTLAQMNHPAIVGVYDFGETPDGLLYFVMEFVNGTDVHKMIQGNGPLPEEHALAIAAHVCDALAYAHQRGVIHRDIKPANILINQEGHVKVADFGLAKMSDPALTSGLTRTNMAMGTPDYAAPEVFASGVTADHRADLYALGVMLYQMLTGEVPRGMFKLPSQKGPGTDPRFDAIIVKAMEANRDERFQSALEVRHALDEILTTPLAKDDGTGVISARALPQRSQVAPQPQPSSSGKAKWIFAAAIVVVLGGAGFLILGGKQEPLAKTQPPASVRTFSPAPVVANKAGVIDLLPLVDVKRDAIAGEWSRDGGDLLVKAAKPGADGTPRLQLPYQPPEEYDFEIEFTPESGTNMVGQALSAYQHSFAWLLDAQLTAGNKAGFNEIDGVSVANRTDGTTMRAKFFLTNGQLHRSTVEVRRTGVRALLDGEPQVTWGSSPKSYERLEIWKNTKLRDALHLGLLAYDRGVRFHKLTVREITGTGKVDVSPVASANPPAANPNSLPAIAKWQDVTEKTREQARATQGLVVEAGAIHRTSSNTPQWLTLTADGQRDYAMRVRYTGEVQVGLRASQMSRNYLFVLCQRHQTIFMRFHDKEHASEKIGATKSHPPGFEPDREHELLVSMQDSRIHAWMDGVFWGEARDETMTDGAAILVFVPQMVLHKVEIAELAAGK